ncbi:MAG: hypothetical protein JWR69_2149 [Pedosphaera sp.]|nr:hypothetical protein [Pedosphaera sp.]
MMTKAGRYGFWAVLLCCTALAANAQVNVTFQVDMGYQITLGTFVPGTDTVEARGSFQNWSAGFPLTNSPGNTNLYTGVYAVTDAEGTSEHYKFIVDGGNGPLGWESPASTGGADRAFTLANTNQTLPAVYFNDQLPPPPVPTTNMVTFQVDMAAQIFLGKFDTAVDTIEARGSFQNWSAGFPLTNSPTATNIYKGVYPITDAAGSIENYKFVVDGGNGPLGWENPASTGGNNRTFTLLNTNAQTLPLVLFNDQPIPSFTNMVTFQVDMTVGVLQGKFVVGTDILEVRGSFQLWNSGFVLTNDPSAGNTNLFTGVYAVTDGAGTVEQYKFVVDGGNGPLGWESPASTGGNNRTFTLANTNHQTLPAVYFNDTALNDILTADTVVTFSVNMANAVGTDAHAFDTNVDSVYLNGVNNGVPGSFWGWGLFPPVPAMTNNPPGSSIYSTEVLVPAGSPLSVSYKYGINGADNEAGFAQNHLRYIRATGTYSMPLDTFGTQYAEPAFGNLAIGAKTAGHVPITWLGRAGVHLQTTTSLGAGHVWQDLASTDGLNSTNYPVGAGNVFFRLVKP